MQTFYVPKWMEQREAEHMNDLTSQFAQLKYAIDTQTATEQDTPISTPVTLGSAELPFFISNRAFGSLSIVSDECTITIANATNTFSYSLGIIKYSSRNGYFLDQTYIYEAGAVILSQSVGNIMLIKPFSVRTTGDVNISFARVNISAVGGKTFVSGYGTYPIQTEFSSSTSSVMKDIQNITIETSYPNAWKISFNSTLRNLAELSYGTDFSITETDDEMTIEFISIPNTFNLLLDAVEMDVQVAPGWVE